jgi:SAM-dependent methyltransferase
VKRIASEQDVTDLTHASKALAVISAFHALGLFEALAEGPKGAEDLPVNGRAFQIAAPILAHLGLLVGDGERYTLSTVGRQLHEARQIPTSANLDYFRDLSRTAEVLRRGGPVHDDDGSPKVTTGGVQPEDPDATRRFLDMLYRRSDASAEQTLAWTSHLLPERGRVLDLGGGHGRYARTYADAGYDATLLDLPLVIDIARERHGEHLRYLAGDFLGGMELGGPWDLVLLSNIVHGQSDEENGSLVGRLAQALAPGGVLVLKDMFLDERERHPARAVFFGMTMLFYTARGRSYSLSEARAWFEAAGLEMMAVTSLDTHDLAMARKPT